MIRMLAVAMTIALGISLQGCATHCHGDVCTRPVSSASNLVIWWSPTMRIEAGPDAVRPDHQVVRLEQ